MSHQLLTLWHYQVGGEALNKTWIWGFGREGSTQQTPWNQQWPNKTVGSRPSLSNPKASNNNESQIKWICHTSNIFTKEDTYPTTIIKHKHPRNPEFQISYIKNCWCRYFSVIEIYILCVLVCHECNMLYKQLLMSIFFCNRNGWFCMFLYVINVICYINNCCSC